MENQREYVLKTVEERGVRFIQLWFTDVLGTPKTFSIPPAELENAIDEGMTFDGSSIDGFSRIQESDVIAHPDPKTFQILPAMSGGNATVARVFCDISNIDGTPFEGDPRHVLRRALERAHERGFSFFAAPELEYFYFASSEADADVPPQPLDSGSYFELTVADLATDLRRKTVLTLEDMGIPVEYAQHEDSPSQHEIDLRYTDALTMADTIMTVRLLIKEIAQEHGVYASFMPKPLAGVQGSGMHTHCSLFHGRQERLLRRRRRTRALGDGAPVHRGPPRARLRDHRGDEPVGELVQAPRRGLRGAVHRLVGVQQPLRARPRSRRAGRASPSPPASSTAPSTRPATPTSPSRSCSPRACRASRSPTSCPTRPTPTCTR